MHRLAVAALGVGLVVGGCSTLSQPGRPAETALASHPGPAYYLLTIEPDAAIDTRDIVLTTYDGAETRPRDLLGPTDLAESGGADIHAKDGRRLVHQIGIPAILEATVDGIPCEGRVELLEDMESDATLLIDGERCVLRLDQRHRMDVLRHRLDAEPAP
jgi:hypothetical protein